jgi:hypothetical protein
LLLAAFTLTASHWLFTLTHLAIQRITCTAQAAPLAQASRARLSPWLHQSSSVQFQRSPRVLALTQSLCVFVQWMRTLLK